MKYIVIDSGEYGASFEYGAYFEYLDSVRHLMPAHLFEFAAKTEHYDLSSPDSLHDAWLERWEIREEDRVSRNVRIEATFIGPRHDRLIHLTYTGVLAYTMHAPEEYALPPPAGHGDLLAHEVTVLRPGTFSHELLFSRGAVFTVQFTDMKHRVELLKPQQSRLRARLRPLLRILHQMLAQRPEL